jgi:hypothetical protein
MDKESFEISEITKNEIFDTLKLNRIAWYGKVDEITFLKRLYNLSELPSTDGRFKNAEGDIYQHTINNYDWDDDWVIYDSRFKILNSSDQTFTRFICEMIHPVIRQDSNEVKQIAELFNRILDNDNWEIFIVKEISKKPIYSARKKGMETKFLKPVIIEKFNSEYINVQIKRMLDSVEKDPSLAIGTAKELLETCLKSILSDLNEPYDNKADIPKLCKITFKKLKLTPEDIPDKAKGAEQIRILLNNLYSICNILAELRNVYGSGHGKKYNFKGLSPRHARLIVGTTSTVTTFIFETYQDRQNQSK